MIVDEKQNKSKPRRGVMDDVWVMSSLRDLMMASAIFYNPAIPSGLEVRNVSNSIKRRRAGRVFDVCEHFPQHIFIRAKQG
jgi:hypothetical protein